MDDCPAHLELITVKSQPGMTEEDFRPSVHNGPTPPKVSRDSLTVEAVCVRGATSETQNHKSGR